MARNVARKRRGYEARTLVRPPVFGQDPTHTCGVDERVGDVVGSAPCEDFDFVHVLAEFAGQLVAFFNQLNVAGHQREARRVVVRQHHVAGLAHLTHVADGAYRAYVVVVAFNTPRCDGRIVHGTAESEIGFYVPFEVAEDGAFAFPTLFEFGVVVHIVDDGEPVSWRRFRIGTVCPEFCQYAAVIRTLHPLLWVRLPGYRVDLVSR